MRRSVLWTAGVMCGLIFLACEDDSSSSIRLDAVNACAAYDRSTNAIAFCISSPDTAVAPGTCEAYAQDTALYAVRGVSSCPGAALISCSGKPDSVHTVQFNAYREQDSLIGAFVCSLIEGAALRDLFPAQE